MYSLKASRSSTIPSTPAVVVVSYAHKLYPPTPIFLGGIECRTPPCSTSLVPLLLLLQQSVQNSVAETTNTCVCLTHLLTRAPCITRFTKLLSFSGTTIHQTLAHLVVLVQTGFIAFPNSTSYKTNCLSVCLSDCPIAKFASTESGRSLNLTPTSPVKCTSMQCTKLRHTDQSFFTAEVR